MFDVQSLAPERLGIVAERLQVAVGLMDGWAATGEVPGSAFLVGRRSGAVEARFAGRRGPGEGEPPLRADALFLAASLTKPVAAIAAMILVEGGRIGLDDPVAGIVPEFAGEGKDAVLIRHLLTHTSGLPDMLPENEALRAAHAPLSAFVEGACRSPLLFAPGTACRYQSMGFAVLGEVVQRATGKPLPAFLRDEVFAPLGMASTSLGWDPNRRDRQTLVRLAPAASATDWHWNSSYWLGLGSPWGGLVTSPADYGRLLRMMLNGGSLDGARILSPAGVRAMRSNQLDAFGAIPEPERRLRGWGLGWRRNWPGSSAYFGDLTGPETFGHWGATGTLAWADPEADAFAVILTSRPPDDRGAYLARLSNVLASAFH